MKSFLRFLKHNPVYTLINIIGLVISLMFVILIGDYTWRQLRADASQPEKDRIFLLGSGTSFYSWPEISHEIGDTYPEIEKTACVISTAGTIRTDDWRFLCDEHNPVILIADSTFFDIFRFRFKEGDSYTALRSPESCVITESLAGQLFPDGNALGMPLTVTGARSVFVNNGNVDPYDSTLVYTVGGVIQDLDATVLPNDTKIILPMSRHPQILGYELANSLYVSTGHGCCKTFYLLGEGVSLDAKTEEISKFINERGFNIYNNGNERYGLTPLRKVMFAPQNDSRGLEKGDKGLLTVLLSAIIAIMFFAVTNYINLTVANTGMRAKEMATRRLLGTSRGSIILKLTGESVLMVAISFLIGLGLAFAFQNDMASLFKGKIMLGNDITPGTVGVCVAFILITGILAGIIPGVQISMFKPVDVVKGSFRYKSKMLFSRIFIMLQNLITVVMLTASLVILLQIRHLVNAPLGVNTEDIVVVTPYMSDCASVQNVLQQQPCVRKIGRTSGTSLIASRASMETKPDKDGNWNLVYTAEMDKTAFDIYGLEILKDYGAMPGIPYVTEEFCRVYGVGEDDREVYYGNGKSEQIAGVLKDFHYGNILNPMAPFKIEMKEDIDGRNTGFLVLTDGSPDALKKITDALYDVLEDKSKLAWTVQESTLKGSFQEQRELSRIVLMFTVIAIVISILGFVGISLFFIRQRRGEIAVRRIMGGSITEVIALMFAKFCTPLLISVVAAVPLAYWIMDRWLQDFSWRIPLSAWIFVVTGLLSLLIAVLSILWQTVRAVRSNPADSVKTE